MTNSVSVVTPAGPTAVTVDDIAAPVKENGVAPVLTEAEIKAEHAEKQKQAKREKQAAKNR